MSQPSHGCVDLHYEPFTAEHLYRGQEHAAPAFLPFVNGWIELTAVLNELARSMGQPDLYPFILPAAALTKLHFVHLVVFEASQAALPAPLTHTSSASA